MTLRCASGGETDLLTQLCEDNSLPMARLKLQVQPWLKLLIAFVCLTLGLRLLCDSGPFVIFVGFALLIRVPSYFYIGWCDFRALKDARLALSLECYPRG